MPPKRKSTEGGGRPAKRVASGTATPASVEESDEYTEGGEEASEGEAEGLRSACPHTALLLKASL